MEINITNPHPGIILKEEFLDELGMTMSTLSEATGIPKNLVRQIIKGKRSISADTDLRLSKFFGLKEGYWLRLQNQFDLIEAKRGNLALAIIEPYQYEFDLKGII